MMSSIKAEVVSNTLTGKIGKHLHIKLSDIEEFRTLGSKYDGGCIVNVRLKEGHKYRKVPMRILTDTMLEFMQSDVIDILATKKIKYYYLTKFNKEESE